jgi:AmiR/NasT family two-component response regulator
MIGDMNSGPEFNPPAVVAQAQGMVSVQAECTLPEALALMRERAIIMGQTLDEIAVAVVDRTIRFGA